MALAVNKPDVKIFIWYAIHIGPMTPYTNPNITNIHNINYPPKYILTPVNIYEFLLSSLISANIPYPLLISTVPLNIN